VLQNFLFGQVLGVALVRQGVEIGWPHLAPVRRWTEQLATSVDHTGETI